MTTINNKINVFDVADYIIINNPHETTHMKMHKMIYYAYAKYLNNHYPKTLFNEKISAWFHGPVINKLYPVFRNFHAKPIKVLTKKGDINKLTPDITNLLDEIIKNYGFLNGSQLRAMTHQEQPWKKAYKTTHWIKNIITKESIYEYFKDKSL